MSSKTPQMAGQFQRSLDVQRMRESRKAGAFAKSAPLPGANSAYGDRDTGRAARNAFIEDMDVASEASAQQVYGGGGNHFLGRNLMQQDMGNQTTLAGAQAGLMGARGRNYDAMNQIYPAQAKLMGAQASDLGARAPLYPAQAGLATAQAADLGARAPLYPAQAGLMKSQGEAMLRPQVQFKPEEAQRLYQQGLSAGGQATREAMRPKTTPAGQLQSQKDRTYVPKARANSILRQLNNPNLKPEDRAKLQQELDAIDKQMQYGGDQLEGDSGTYSLE